MRLSFAIGLACGVFGATMAHAIDQGPVLVIPGFLCSDQTTFSLRRELARQGFRVHGWKNGWNLGAREDTLATARALRDAGATMLLLRFVSDSVAHHIEQLEAMADLTPAL